MALRQGLLAATSASIRLAQKRAQTERPRLQSRARREKLASALKDAQTAAAAAQALIQGAGRHAPGCLDRPCPSQQDVKRYAVEIDQTQECYLCLGRRRQQRLQHRFSSQDELHSTLAVQAHEALALHSRVCDC